MTGRPLAVLQPPPEKYREGAFKKAPKISDEEYNRVMVENGWQWDERVCTKGKTIYQTTKKSIQAGHNVTICNDVKDFSFENIDWNYYVNEAKKIIVC